MFLEQLEDIIMHKLSVSLVLKISKCINYLEVWSELKIRKLKREYIKLLSYKNMFIFFLKTFHHKISHTKHCKYVNLFFLTCFTQCSLYGIVKYTYTSRNNIWCRIFRLQVTQNGYPKTEERTSLNWIFNIWNANLNHIKDSYMYMIIWSCKE